MRVTKEQAAENRRLILRSASRLFRQHGVNGVGVADVVKDAGLTHGALYSHFQSKDELVSESCQFAMKEMAEIFQSIATTSDSVECYENIIRKYLSLEHRDHPEEGCVMAGLAQDVGRLPQVFQQKFRQELEGFINFLMEHQKEGSPKIARNEMIVALSAMVGAMTLARAVDDKALSQEILQIVADDLVNHR